MKINSKILGIIVLVVIFGGIGLSSALGYWNTENSGGGGQGEGAGLTTSEGEANVRGKTTFQDLLNLGLPQETIEQVIGGPMPEPLTRINNYCETQGLDFETVKEALQAEIDKLDQ